MQNIDKILPYVRPASDYDNETLEREAKEALKRFDIRAQKRAINDATPKWLSTDVQAGGRDPWSDGASIQTVTLA